ncbi:hypothetical protein CMO91_05400 [Candidatus Woesearchaeota archaeon]|nr:hypothetical protein [Candidatus Woesearchaeota archaeon]|tara:strand:- start:1508 stop:2068 length:561 start_codon:yes stop_codon:yes gene_type:complete
MMPAYHSLLEGSHDESVAQLGNFIVQAQPQVSSTLRNVHDQIAQGVGKKYALKDVIDDEEFRIFAGVTHNAGIPIYNLDLQATIAGRVKREYQEISITPLPSNFFKNIAWTSSAIGLAHIIAGHLLVAYQKIPPQAIQLFYHHLLIPTITAAGAAFLIGKVASRKNPHLVIADTLEQRAQHISELL